MEYFDLIQKRYSVRSYRPDPVEPEKLNQVLEAARIAPTAANRQPFKVLVIKTAGRQGELQRIYSRDWFGAAPLVLCVCTNPAAAWVRRDQKNYADVDAAIVMDHMILAATALGLGTCWIGAFDLRAAREILKLDPEWEPVVFTPLGYVEDAPAAKTRKSLAELIVYQ